jgi:Domain of unknown function (DUF4397)
MRSKNGRIRGTFYGFLAVLLAVTALAGLAGIASPQGVSAQDIQTRVMWLHAGVSTGKVEVHINGDEKLDEFSYSDVSDWIDIEPGADRVTITADRAGINYAIFDAVYPVPAGNDYHAIITDVLVLANVVDRSPIPDGSARVRIVQASVDTPQVNVIATASNTTFASQLGYSQSSDYVVVPAGSYDIAVNQADSGQNLLSQTGISLEANMVYDLVLMGEPGNGDKPLTLTSLADSTVEHGTPEATPSS